MKNPKAKKEHLKTTWRGVKWLYQLDKGYTISLFFGAFLAAAIPFIPIYFSALIIDELVGKRCDPLDYTRSSHGRAVFCIMDDS